MKLHNNTFNPEELAYGFSIESFSDVEFLNQNADAMETFLVEANKENIVSLFQTHFSDSELPSIADFLLEEQRYQCIQALAEHYGFQALDHELFWYDMIQDLDIHNYGYLDGIISSLLPKDSFYNDILFEKQLEVENEKAFFSEFVY